MTTYCIGHGKYAIHAHAFLPHHKQLIAVPISGNGLGGSSSINCYVFTQPPASDIDGMLLLRKLNCYY